MCGQCYTDDSHGSFHNVGSWQLLPAAKYWEKSVATKRRSLHLISHHFLCAYGLQWVLARVWQQDNSHQNTPQTKDGTLSDQNNLKFFSKKIANMICHYHTASIHIFDSALLIHCVRRRIQECADIGACCATMGFFAVIGTHTILNPISNSREKHSAQIGVEVMSYCVIEVRMIPITYFISIQYCEMLQEYLSLEGYKHHPMCKRCTQNLQSVWPIASLALISATFVSPIGVLLIRKEEPVHFRNRGTLEYRRET